ncbi:hypothetical protein [Hyalangium rubrum]|uniref:DUF3618 domain-containing protein n=1 Tax=Hyalangium rubrum TaxID=3103134 RepID=A0ABU5H6S9_9BACT|nr:hypothetical protein [Hyalangium sp. s54d21]MDY7229050.1 hypothetical protein [Hyalangium sp. s54d21]
MSEIADELALHAQPERVKEIASEKVSEWKEKAKELATEKAGELKQQAKDVAVEKATEIKTRAKEAVMNRTMELKERADTPRGWSLLGAILGAGVGAVLMKKAFAVREERAGDGYDPSEAMHSVKDKAHELKDKAVGAVGQVRDQASHLRERIPSGGEMKVRTSDWFDRTLESQPLMLAIGGIALGMFASMLLPVSNRERQLIEPAKRKAQESLSQLGDQLEQKLQGNAGDVSASSSSMSSSMDSSTMGYMGSSEGLMGAERPGFEESDRSETLASPTGSRIPPLAPLDDLTSKIH